MSEEGIINDALCEVESEKAPAKSELSGPVKLRELDQEVLRLRAEIVGFRSANTRHEVRMTEDQDSLEYGLQASGRIKVYGDFSKAEEFKNKVSKAVLLVEHAREKMSVETKGD